MLSQTFVTNEILEMRRQGIDVELYALLRHHEATVHPDARAVAQGTLFPRLVSFETAAAHAHWLVRRPRALLSTWYRALRASGRSPTTLAAAAVTLIQAATIAHVMRDRRVGHVHAHFATHAALAAWAIRRLAGIPYSITTHSYDLTVSASMLNEKFEDATFVVVISDYYHRWLEARISPRAWRKLRVVRLGVDTDRLRPTAPSRRSGPPTLLCAARLSKVKGHRYLIEAYAMLRRRGVPARLVLAGGGELVGRLRAQARELGVEDGIAFVGELEHEHMLRAMAEADVVVLASAMTARGEREGIPVSLMEAMALGTPVVATDISGVPELIAHGRSGLLVPQRDPGALAEALATLLGDDGLAAQLARAARATIESEYSLKENCATLRHLMASRSDLQPDRPG